METNKDGRKIVEHKGIYFKLEGDPRWHTDNETITRLYQDQVPVYWEDTCPNCGNSEHISGCRCPTNHRTCPKCHYMWHWAFDKINIKWVRVMSEGH